MLAVMTGLVPVIHAVPSAPARLQAPTAFSTIEGRLPLTFALALGVDGRDKPGHDVEGVG
jgi:hypothetical protein